MASAAASLSTICTSFTTHCAISNYSPKTPFSQSTFFPFSRTHSLSLSFQPTLSPRLPLLPPKSSDTAQALSDPQPATQLVQSPPLQPPSWEPGLFAVVMVGGRQYIVHPGRWITVQRLKGAKVNDKIALHRVLLVGTDTSCYIGRPVVTNAVVYATVEEQGLDDKVIVFKYKKKKKYRRTIGHRQPNTRIRINSIMGYENYPKVTMDDIKDEDKES
ncbi:50S ribosomal protein L21, chloroplastic [Arachis duranensis]|uniref:50S ribosomal protein L21, chloroplastic n=1 Tax=Arachis duranensis TaxID=130453 RepID=A0A6P4BSL5_ARADU|nr:50S ribosomal protein L21, chloroplastic [Arachis duranensis]